MKKYIYQFFIWLALTSCIIEEAPNGDSTNTTIINNSRHSIELQEFYHGEYKNSSFIDHNEKIEFHTGGGGDAGGFTGPDIPFLSVDSVWVIYYEKASIMHTTDINSPVTKSLMLQSSYEGGKVKDGLYEFTYTFTPEDFEEALEFGD